MTPDNAIHWESFEPRIRRFTPEQRARIRAAFDLGEEMHRGQKRKSGEPYFMHPITVAEMIADMGGDADSVIVSLLHDTVEDTALTIEETGRRFGPSVQMLIDGLTKLSAQDIAQKPSVNEQVETLRKIFTLTQSDVRIMVIKLADRLHNMRTIAGLSPSRQIEFSRETQDVYVKFANQLSMRAVRDELEEHCQSVLDPDTLERLRALRAAGLERAEDMERPLRDLLGKMAPQLEAAVSYEPLSWQKLRAQLDKPGSAVTGAPSHAVSVVCATVDDCYAALGILHQRWQREVHSFQDYVNAPVSNGYRAIHTTLFLEDGTRLQCKIRTREMHEYARRGIAYYCFGSEAHDPLQYLPWLHRIAPLAEDTKDRSKEFWDGLQNDILAKSILVYASDGTAASLPAGSTALDAAIHLLQERAMFLLSLRRNGQAVPMSARIAHGDSLDFVLGAQETVRRDWLEWVGTSYSAAAIRTGLLRIQSEAQRAETGRQLLQRVLHEAKKGFLEEFSERNMDAAIRTIGYASLHEALIAIAEGHLDPLDAYIALFDTRRRSDSKRSCVIGFFADPARTELLAYLATLEESRDSFRELRYRYRPADRGGDALLRMSLTAQEQNAVLAELRMRGAARITVNPASLRLLSALGIAVLIVLWGLDPVLGRLLITRHGITAVDLTLVRFLSLTAMSGFLLLATHLRTTVRLAPLPLANAALWGSVATLVAVAMTSYAALAGTQASHYTIPMTAAGLLLTGIVNWKRRPLAVAVTWAALLAGIAVLAVADPSWLTLRGAGMTLAAVASFSAFSVISERYKRGYKVGIRSAQYFFTLSFLCLLLALPLIPFSTLGAYPPHVIAEMAAFCIGLAGIPYYLYYYALGHREIDFVLRYSFLIIPATLIGQVLLHEPVSRLTVLAGLIVSAGAMLPILVRLIGDRKEADAAPL